MIMKFIEDLKFNRQRSLQNREFLRKGLYILLPNMRTYAHLRSYGKALRDFPIGGCNIKNVLKMLVGFQFMFYVSSSGGFEGEILYFSTISEFENRDIKIFSAQKLQVRIQFANSVRADLYLKNRKRNENEFPLTVLYEYNKEKQYAIEEYIIKKNKKNISKKVLEKLFEFYLQYYIECIGKGKYVDLAQTELTKEYGISSVECPVLFLAHGDLSCDNYIYREWEEQPFIFIDFDHEDYYPPFYDIIFLICNQAFVWGDDSWIKMFNEGYFDRYLLKYAAIKGIHIEDILTSCIKCLWYKRFYVHHENSKEKIKEVFKEIMSKARGRYANG